MSAAYGIEALNIYAGLARIPVPALVAGRGLDPSRIDNIMMTHRSIGLPFEDPVTNAVNAARPLLDAMTAEERERIELLVTSTESGVDLSKSVSSYVHEYLGLSRHCRLIEVKQACYAATAAIQLAIGQAASGVAPGAKALVVATDVSLVDERAGFAEPATGHGAAAVLIGDNPRVLTADLGAYGLYSYETMDSARPTPRFDVADVDRSLFAYLDCLSHSFADYAARVEGADFARTFAHLAMHTPFAGLVRAGHRKLMRETADALPHSIEEDFQRRVAPSLVYPATVGNLCSGSVYLALASLIDHAGLTTPSRVGLYSYGSGCSSEFFSGLADADSAAALRPMAIGAHLSGRTEIDFATYTALLTQTLSCLVPEKHREIRPDRWASYLDAAGRGRRLLVHTGTKDFHRQYDWV